MSDVILSRLGQRIRNLRIQAGLSQEELAERADFHPTYLGGIERGERNLSFRNLEKLAEALLVPLKKLFDFGDERTNRTAEDVKELIVRNDPRMETFFGAFCGKCRYLTSLLGMRENRCHLIFYSIVCKNCPYLKKFRQFIRTRPQDKS